MFFSSYHSSLGVIFTSALSISEIVTTHYWVVPYATFMMCFRMRSSDSFSLRVSTKESKDTAFGKSKAEVLFPVLRLAFHLFYFHSSKIIWEKSSQRTLS